MADQDISITLPLNVDPTPAVEALKSFLSVCQEVGQQSQKLLSGEMLAPSFGEIDETVSDLTQRLSEMGSGAEEAATGMSDLASAETETVPASRAATEATEAQATSQMGLMDAIRSSRAEHRLGMFAIMALMNTTQGLTGRNREMVQTFSQAAQAGFGVSFMMEALGKAELALPLGMVAAGMSLIITLMNAQKEMTQGLMEDSEKLTRAEVDMGQKGADALRQLDEQKLEEAKISREQAESQPSFWSSLASGIMEAVQAGSSGILTMQRIKDMADAEVAEAEARLQLHKDDLDTQNKWEQQVDKNMSMAEAEHDLGKLTTNQLVDKLRLEELATNDAEKKLQIELKVKQLLEEQTKERKKQIEDRGKTMVSGAQSGRMEFVTGQRNTPDWSGAMEEFNNQYESGKNRAEGIKDETDKENALYALEVEHITKTEDAGKLRESELYALKVDHEDRLTQLDDQKSQETFEREWGYAEQLGNILGDAFNKGNSQAQKVIQGLQVMVQIAKQISILQQPGSDQTGGLLNIIGSLIKIPFLAEGGVVSRPTLSMVGEAGPEAVVPLSSLNTPLPLSRGDFGEMSAMANEIRDLHETIKNQTLETSFNGTDMYLYMKRTNTAKGRFGI